MPWSGPSSSDYSTTSSSPVVVGGSVDNGSALSTVTNQMPGVAYFTRDDGHLHIWDGSQWIDLGAVAAGGGGGGGSIDVELSYTHTQSVAAETWTFTHNLPFHPGGVRVEDASDPEIVWNIDVDYDAAAKRFVLHFPVPVAGQVTVS